MGLLQRLFGKKKQSTQASSETSTPHREETQEPSHEEPKQATQEETPKDDVDHRNQTKPYHVSQNKDKDSEFFEMWLVKREQSNKTLKHFKTQHEAIDYAKTLAESQDTKVVVHKKDGTIREQH